MIIYISQYWDWIMCQGHHLVSKSGGDKEIQLCLLKM